jgi:pseudouridine-5'-phosphate glycosidase
LQGGVMIANSIHEEYAMDKNKIDQAVEQALKELVEQNVTGKDSTPLLLARVSELTGGDSLVSNIQLVLNNARLGSAIAINYCNIQQKG